MPVFDEVLWTVSRPDYEPASTARDLQAFMLRSQVKNFFNDVVTSWDCYSFALQNGERKGQAFFNSLPDEMSAKIRGTLIDPFHKNDEASILKALDYLILS